MGDMATHDSKGRCIASGGKWATSATSQAAATGRQTQTLGSAAWGWAGHHLGSVIRQSPSFGTAATDTFIAMFC